MRKQALGRHVYLIPPAQHECMPILEGCFGIYPLVEKFSPSSI
jgi:hypothetical protein